MSPMMHMKAFKKALHEAHEELTMYQAKSEPISHRGERWNPYSFEEGYVEGLYSCNEEPVSPAERALLLPVPTL